MNSFWIAARALGAGRGLSSVLELVMPKNRHTYLLFVITQLNLAQGQG
jgi:hypothetical protein